MGTRDLPTTYDGWAEYLKKARNGHDRPIGKGTQPRECSGPFYCWARQWTRCDQDHDDNGRHLTCEHGETARHYL